MPDIPLIQEGGESLVSAKRANEIIVPLNAIMGGKVAPIAGVGFIKYAGGQFILDLSALDGRLRAVEGLFYGPAGNNTVSLNTRVTHLEQRLNNANITASGTCNANVIAINISLNI